MLWVFISLLRCTYWLCWTNLVVCISNTTLKNEISFILYVFCDPVRNHFSIRAFICTYNFMFHFQITIHQKLLHNKKMLIIKHRRLTLNWRIYIILTKIRSHKSTLDTHTFSNNCLQLNYIVDKIVDYIFDEIILLILHFMY